MLYKFLLLLVSCSQLNFFLQFFNCIKFDNYYIFSSRFSHASQDERQNWINGSAYNLFELRPLTPEMKREEMGDFSHGKTHAAGHCTGSVRSLPGSSVHVCGNGAKIAAGINPTKSYHRSYTSLIF